MKTLGDLAWPSVAPGSLVLVPLGSTEQHGPHLPFATDSLIAEAVARAVAPSGSLVAPTMSYGASGEHQDFPGTTSIGSDALRTTLIEIVRSLSTWATRILFVNGHGGNLDALSSAIPQLANEGHSVAWVACGVRGGDAHAGRTESSLMLHLHPQLVDMTVAVPGNTAPMSELLPELRASGTRALSETGVLGDPTGASPEEGAALFAEMVGAVTSRLESWMPDARGCLA